MPNGYSQTPLFIKGALVALSEPFLGPVPNIILFQYNPESLTRTLSPWATPTQPGEDATAEEKKKFEASLAQPFDPGESFTLTLELDATDALESPYLHPVAFISGVADKIAALEMLLYPPGEGLLSGFFGSLGGLLGGDSAAISRKEVPVVLFIWGPGRIVPVRLSTFQVEEQAFNTALYPIRARVTVGLTVLTDAAFGTPVKGKPNEREVTKTAEKIAVWSYKWTRGQKEVLARVNLADEAVDTVLGAISLF